MRLKVMSGLMACLMVSACGGVPEMFGPVIVEGREIWVYKRTDPVNGVVNWFIRLTDGTLVYCGKTLDICKERSADILDTPSVPPHGHDNDNDNDNDNDRDDRPEVPGIGS